MDKPNRNQIESESANFTQPYAKFNREYIGGNWQAFLE